MAMSHIFPEPLRGSDPDVRTPLWFQIASRLLLLLAAALLFLSLGTRVYASNLVVAAFAVVFLAQGCAGFLYAHGWYAERRRTSATKRELSSMQNLYEHMA